MTEQYQRFHTEHFTPKKYKAYQKEFTKNVGKLYELSTTPYFVNIDVTRHIKTKVLPTIMKLLLSPSYQDKLYEDGWFLPALVPIKRHDLFGSADFHINGDDIRLIELNFFTPGHIELVEMFDSLFNKHFDMKNDFFSKGFESKFSEFLNNRFNNGMVAICVDHDGFSLHYRNHYEYIESFLRKHGVRAKIVQAKDAGYSKTGKPMWDDIEYDGIFNLVIPKVWHDNKGDFKKYTKLFKTAPETFFPNPWCWPMGDKRFLTILSCLKDGDFGLNSEDVKVLRSVSLRSKLMSDCKSSKEVCELYGGLENIVLKPVDNFQTQGVYINPSVEKVKKLFKSAKKQYIIQEYFPSEIIPYKDEKGDDVEAWHMQLRAEFLNGSFSNMRAYGYEDHFGSSPITPVVVVS